MRNQFQVTGLFYEKENKQFRKYLDIKRLGVNQTKPDLMVVMMNPGSSKPLNDSDHNEKAVLAVPDPTQDQIMRIMQSTNLNFAKILNLSDLRTPKSKELYSFFKSNESSTIDHSIFSEARKKELSELFNKNALTIFAWGVNKQLLPLAQRAVEALRIENPHGVLKNGTKYSYYHPLPQVYKEQEAWVKMYPVKSLGRSKSELVFEVLGAQI